MQRVLQFPVWVVLGTLATTAWAWSKDGFVDSVLSEYRKYDQAARADTAKDGIITETEFMYSLYKQSDANGNADNQVSRDEFIDYYTQRYNISSELATVMFDYLNDPGSNDDVITPADVSLGSFSGRNYATVSEYREGLEKVSITMKTTANLPDVNHTIDRLELELGQVTVYPMVFQGETKGGQDFVKNVRKMWLRQSAEKLYTTLMSPHVVGPQRESELRYNAMLSNMDTNNDDVITIGELNDELKRFNPSQPARRRDWVWRTTQRYGAEPETANLVFDYWDRDRDMELTARDLQYLAEDMDLNGDGKVSRPDFVRFVERGYQLSKRMTGSPLSLMLIQCPDPWWSEMGWSPNIDATRAAMDFDDDLNGWITLADLRRWLDIFDQNDDGSIDRQEFSKFHTERYGVNSTVAVTMFKLADTNGDGRLEEQDWEFHFKDGFSLSFCDARRSIMDLTRMGEKFRGVRQDRELRQAMERRLQEEWSWYLQNLPQQQQQQRPWLPKDSYGTGPTSGRQNLCRGKDECYEGEYTESWGEPDAWMWWGMKGGLRGVGGAPSPIAGQMGGVSGPVGGIPNQRLGSSGPMFPQPQWPGMDMSPMGGAPFPRYRRSVESQSQNSENAQSDRSVDTNNNPYFSNYHRLFRPFSETARGSTPTPIRPLNNVFRQQQLGEGRTMSQDRPNNVANFAKQNGLNNMGTQRTRVFGNGKSQSSADSGTQPTPNPNVVRQGPTWMPAQMPVLGYPIVFGFDPWMFGGIPNWGMVGRRKRQPEDEASERLAAEMEVDLGSDETTRQRRETKQDKKDESSKLNETADKGNNTDDDSWDAMMPPPPGFGMTPWDMWMAWMLDNAMWESMLMSSWQEDNNSTDGNATDPIDFEEIWNDMMRWTKETTEMDENDGETTNGSREKRFTMADRSAYWQMPWRTGSTNFRNWYNGGSGGSNPWMNSMINRYPERQNNMWYNRFQSYRRKRSTDDTELDPSGTDAIREQRSDESEPFKRDYSKDGQSSSDDEQDSVWRSAARKFESEDNWKQQLNSGSSRWNQGRNDMHGFTSDRWSGGNVPTSSFLTQPAWPRNYMDSPGAEWKYPQSGQPSFMWRGGHVKQPFTYGYQNFQQQPPRDPLVPRTFFSSVMSPGPGWSSKNMFGFDRGHMRPVGVMEPQMGFPGWMNQWRETFGGSPRSMFSLRDTGGKLGRLGNMWKAWYSRFVRQVNGDSNAGEEESRAEERLKRDADGAQREKRWWGEFSPMNSAYSPDQQMWHWMTWSAYPWCQMYWNQFRYPRESGEREKRDTGVDMDKDKRWDDWSGQHQQQQSFRGNWMSPTFWDVVCPTIWNSVHGYGMPNNQQFRMKREADAGDGTADSSATSLDNRDRRWNDWWNLYGDDHDCVEWTTPTPAWSPWRGWNMLRSTRAAAGQSESSVDESSSSQTSSSDKNSRAVRCRNWYRKNYNHGQDNNYHRMMSDPMGDPWGGNSQWGFMRNQRRSGQADDQDLLREKRDTGDATRHERQSGWNYEYSNPFNSFGNSWWPPQYSNSPAWSRNMNNFPFQNNYGWNRMPSYMRTPRAAGNGADSISGTRTRQERNTAVEGSERSKRFWNASPWMSNYNWMNQDKWYGSRYPESSRGFNWYSNYPNYMNSWNNGYSQNWMRNYRSTGEDNTRQKRDAGDESREKRGMKYDWNMFPGNNWGDNSGWRFMQPWWSGSHRGQFPSHFWDNNFNGPYQRFRREIEGKDQLDDLNRNKRFTFWKNFNSNPRFGNWEGQMPWFANPQGNWWDHQRQSNMRNPWRFSRDVSEMEKDQEERNKRDTGEHREKREFGSQWFYPGWYGNGWGRNWGSGFYQPWHQWRFWPRMYFPMWFGPDNYWSLMRNARTADDGDNQIDGSSKAKREVSEDSKREKRWSGWNDFMGMFGNQWNNRYGQYNMYPWNDWSSMGSFNRMNPWMNNHNWNMDRFPRDSAEQKNSDRTKRDVDESSRAKRFQGFGSFYPSWQQSHQTMGGNWGRYPSYHQRQFPYSWNPQGRSDRQNMFGNMWGFGRNSRETSLTDEEGENRQKRDTEDVTSKTQTEIRGKRMSMWDYFPPGFSQDWYRGHGNPSSMRNFWNPWWSQYGNSWDMMRYPRESEANTQTRERRNSENGERNKRWDQQYRWNPSFFNWQTGPFSSWNFPWRNGPGFGNRFMWNSGRYGRETDETETESRNRSDVGSDERVKRWGWEGGNWPQWWRNWPGRQWGSHSSMFPWNGDWSSMGGQWSNSRYPFSRYSRESQDDGHGRTKREVEDQSREKRWWGNGRQFPWHHGTQWSPYDFNSYTNWYNGPRWGGSMSNSMRYPRETEQMDSRNKRDTENREKRWWGNGGQFPWYQSGQGNPYSDFNSYTNWYNGPWWNRGQGMWNSMRFPRESEQMEKESRDKRDTSGENREKRWWGYDRQFPWYQSTQRNPYDFYNYRNWYNGPQWNGDMWNSMRFPWKSEQTELRNKRDTSGENREKRWWGYDRQFPRYQSGQWNPNRDFNSYANMYNEPWWNRGQGMWNSMRFPRESEQMEKESRDTRDTSGEKREKRWWGNNRQFPWHQRTQWNPYEFSSYRNWYNGPDWNGDMWNSMRYPRESEQIQKEPRNKRDTIEENREKRRSGYGRQYPWYQSRQMSPYDFSSHTNMYNGQWWNNGMGMWNSMRFPRKSEQIESRDKRDTSGENREKRWWGYDRQFPWYQSRQMNPYDFSSYTNRYNEPWWNTGMGMWNSMRYPRESEQKEPRSKRDTAGENREKRWQGSGQMPWSMSNYGGNGPQQWNYQWGQNWDGNFWSNRYSNRMNSYMPFRNQWQNNMWNSMRYPRETEDKDVASRTEREAEPSEKVKRWQNSPWSYSAMEGWPYFDTSYQRMNWTPFGNRGWQGPQGWTNDRSNYFSRYYRDASQTDATDRTKRDADTEDRVKRWQRNSWYPESMTTQGRFYNPFHSNFNWQNEWTNYPRSHWNFGTNPEMSSSYRFQRETDQDDHSERRKRDVSDSPKSERWQSLNKTPWAGDRQQGFWNSQNSMNPWNENRGRQFMSGGRSWFPGQSSNWNWRRGSNDMWNWNPAEMTWRIPRHAEEKEDSEAQSNTKRDTDATGGRAKRWQFREGNTWMNPWYNWPNDFVFGSSWFPMSSSSSMSHHWPSYSSSRFFRATDRSGSETSESNERSKRDTEDNSRAKRWYNNFYSQMRGNSWNDGWRNPYMNWNSWSRMNPWWGYDWNSMRYTRNSEYDQERTKRDTQSPPGERQKRWWFDWDQDWINNGYPNWQDSNMYGDNSMYSTVSNMGFGYPYTGGYNYWTSMSRQFPSRYFRNTHQQQQQRNKREVDNTAKDKRWDSFDMMNQNYWDNNGDMNQGWFGPSGLSSTRFWYPWFGQSGAFQNRFYRETSDSQDTGDHERLKRETETVSRDKRFGEWGYPNYWPQQSYFPMNYEYRWGQNPMMYFHRDRWMAPSFGLWYWWYLFSQSRMPWYTGYYWNYPRNTRRVEEMSDGKDDTLAREKREADSDQERQKRWMGGHDFSEGFGNGYGNNWNRNQFSPFFDWRFSGYNRPGFGNQNFPWLRSSMGSGNNWWEGNNFNNWMRRPRDDTSGRTKREVDDTERSKRWYGYGQMYDNNQMQGWGGDYPWRPSQWWNMNTDSFTGSPWGFYPWNSGFRTYSQSSYKRSSDVDEQKADEAVSDRAKRDVDSQTRDKRWWQFGGSGGMLTPQYDSGNGWRGGFRDHWGSNSWYPGYGAYPWTGRSGWMPFQRRDTTETRSKRDVEDATRNKRWWGMDYYSTMMSPSFDWRRGSFNRWGSNSWFPWYRNNFWGGGRSQMPHRGKRDTHNDETTRSKRWWQSGRPDYNMMSGSGWNSRWGGMTSNSQGWRNSWSPNSWSAMSNSFRRPNWNRMGFPNNRASMGGGNFYRYKRNTDESSRTKRMNQWSWYPRSGQFFNNMGQHNTHMWGPVDQRSNWNSGSNRWGYPRGSNWQWNSFMRMPRESVRTTVDKESTRQKRDTSDVSRDKRWNFPGYSPFGFNNQWNSFGGYNPFNSGSFNRWNPRFSNWDRNARFPRESTDSVSGDQERQKRDATEDQTPKTKRWGSYGSRMGGPYNGSGMMQGRYYPFSWQGSSPYSSQSRQRWFPWSSPWNRQW